MNAIALISQMQYRAERVLLGAAFLTLLVLCGLYMYFISLSVVHVVVSQETDVRIHEMRSDIAKQEAEYMEMQNALSREVVEQKGYIAATEKIFIDRSAGSLVTKR